jgi:predicted DsbA family dithiol-disulfide isomerase
MNRELIACFLSVIVCTACAQASDSGQSEDTQVVARFGDRVITEADLEANEDLQRQLIAVRQQEYEITRQHVERMVFDQLLDQAAEEEGIPRAEYVQQKVDSQIPEPAEAQVNALLNQYRARLDPDPDKARQQVVDALKQQNRARVEAGVKEQMFQAAGVSILLEPLRFEIEIADSNPSRGGGPDAPVILVEYTDFQCPFCIRVQPTLDTVVSRYGDNVRHVFKHLPLAMHAEARLAAEASMCAGEQGKFWELHDWLFANSKNLSRETILEQARALELDEEIFTACLDDETYAAAVQQDMIEAQGLGISGTPGFLVNGRILRGAQPLDAFVEVINDELRRAGIEVPAAPAVAAESAPAEDAPTEDAPTEDAPTS